jgi:hypothetical protein
MFVGKKSVPRALRKDQWTPLCVLSFPNPLQGINAFALLREFLVRHQTEYPLESITLTKGPNAGNLMSRTERSFKLMDQKANSIADMAHVLSMQARPPTPEVIKRAKYLVRTDKRPVAKRGPGSRKTHNVFEFQGRIQGTTVWWANVLDAEFAETWPAEVVHGKLAVSRNTAVWPPPEKLVTKPIEITVRGDGEEEERAAIQEAVEERRKLLNRSSEVDINEKIRDAEARMQDPLTPSTTETPKDANSETKSTGWMGTLKWFSGAEKQNTTSV